MNFIVSVLASILIVLAALAVAIKIVTKRVAIALALGWLFFYGVHPGAREGVMAALSPLFVVGITLFLILFGLSRIIRGKWK